MNFHAIEVRELRREIFKKKFQNSLGFITQLPPSLK